MSESPDPARSTLQRKHDSATAGAPGRRVASAPKGVAGSALILLLLTLFAAPSAAQGRGEGTRTGSVSGRVLDAEAGTALRGAVVVLRRVAGPGGPVLPDASAARYRSAVTDSGGEYAFRSLPPANYRLHFHRIGYLADSVDVDLRASGETGISLALEPEPVVLPPLQVLGYEVEPFTRGEGRVGDGATPRIAVAVMRQEDNLATDAREMTLGEVAEAATLAETDVFRALQRIPGVNTRDDYTATLWTRGASWDQTRVYLDGLPLYNPTHAGWLFSAVNPDGIGAVTFHPGSRSARWGEGSAAILDLRSRRGGLGGSLRGQGELSLASARFALDDNLFDGKLGWMVAGRRTYVDLVSALYGSLTNDREDVIPYDFTDLIARVDGDLGRGWGITTSGIFEQDRLRGEVRGLLRGNHGQWGNRAGQATLTVPFRGLSGRIGVGRTWFRAAIGVDSTSRRLPGEDEPTLPAVESTVRHERIALELGPTEPRANHWALGYQGIRDEVEYAGPVSLLSAIAVLLPRGQLPEPGEFRSGADLGYHALWGELHLRPLRTVEVEAGVRWELGDSVPNGGTSRPAPRFAARLRPDERTMLAVGWSRAFQYTQDIAPVAGPLGPQLHLSHLWVLAERDRYSAVRADIATVGVERWLDPEWLAAVNLYRRYTTGLALPNPVSERVTPDRDADAGADNLATGVELSVRRLVGRVTGSAGYTYGWSTIRKARATTLESRDTVLADFPSPADVRHAVDAAVTVRLSKSLRAGGAFTYGSGIPFTQLILPDSTQIGRDPWLGEPNAKRTPSYASLDLVTDYSTTVGRWQITAYAQLRNALNRDNSVTYARSQECPGEPPNTTRGGVRVCAQDSFERGIPRLPLLGVRLRF